MVGSSGYGNFILVLVIILIDNKMKIDYNAYLRNVYLDIIMEKNMSAPDHIIEDRFKDFYFGWLSMCRYSKLMESSCREDINNIFRAVIGVSLDDYQNIVQRMGRDSAKERGLGHGNFDKNYSELEAEIITKFNRIIGY